MFRAVYALMGGMERKPLVPPPFAAGPGTARTVMSVLGAAHTGGRGVLGFLTPEELRELRVVNRELFGEVEMFPLGRDTATYQTLEFGLRDEDSIMRWRNVHPKAKNIKLFGPLNDALLIAFLSVEYAPNRVDQLDRLDLSPPLRLGGGPLGAAVPSMGALRELLISGARFDLPSLMALDVSRLESFAGIDVPVDEACIQRMVHLRKLKVGMGDGPRVAQLMTDPDFSMLPLEEMYASGIGKPRLRQEIAKLTLRFIETPFGAYFSAFNRMRSLTLNNCNLTGATLPPTLRELAIVECATTDAVLTGLDELEILEMETVIGITDEIFRRVPRLASLTLVDHQEEGMTGDMFRYLPRLEVFSADRTTLRQIGAMRFRSALLFEMVDE